MAALIQRRWIELMQGARPLVKVEGKTELETIVQEILEDKIAIDYENCDVSRPDQLKNKSSK